MKNRVLIVGQGLAGSVLAMHFLQSGIKPYVVDLPTKSRASRIAAGIMNPLVFRYLTLSWNAKLFYDQAMSFYRQMEALFGVHLIKPVSISRLYGVGEQQLWVRKSHLDGFKHLIEPLPAESLDPAVDSLYGYGRVNHAAWLNLPVFLNQVKIRLQELNTLIEAEVSYDDFIFENHCVIYKDVAYEAVVFCEGWQVVQNPWFSYVPFRPVRGDVLTVRIAGLNEQSILNKEIFLLPMGDHVFRLGSTYDWDHLNEIPDLAAAGQLLSKLRSIVNLPVEVLDHEAGIRPAVADRRPVAGNHPALPKIHILNGLGAKGVMLAPAMAHSLTSLILDGVQPATEYNVNRFNLSEKQTF